MFGRIIDAIMLISLFWEFFYVFEGNLLHEILGVVFFVCFLIHLYIKRKWIKNFLKKTNKELLISKIVMVLLFISIILAIVSSIGVSMTLFRNSVINFSKDFHVICVLCMSILIVIHVGMYKYVRTNKKKKTIILTLLSAIVVASIVLFLVSYLNRHFKTVTLDDKEKIVSGDKVKTKKKVLAVYFTRVGNTDFEKDVDAVSGASLMKDKDKLVGNTELMANMVGDILDCDVEAIKLKDKKYPSSYSDTTIEAKKEFDGDLKPEIEKIDVSKYDNIILVYPIWWFKAPMPVISFLESADFSKKNIYLLATQGSSGFADSTSHIKEHAKKAKVEEGISIYCDDVPKSREDIRKWIDNIKDNFK